MTPADLKAARKALGLSQRGLAEAIGVSKPSIARWEGGRRAIPLTIALAIEAISSRDALCCETCGAGYIMYCDRCSAI